MYEINLFSLHLFPSWEKITVIVTAFPFCYSMRVHKKPFPNRRTNYNPFNGHSCLIYWVAWKRCEQLIFLLSYLGKISLFFSDIFKVSFDITLLKTYILGKVESLSTNLLTYPDLSNLICVLISCTLKTDNSSNS